MDANDRTAALVRNNWLEVCDEVAQACRESGRQPEDVTIVGVSKYVSPALAHQLVLAGCRNLGESRPQHLWDVHNYCDNYEAENAGIPAVNWHMIGHLQRNKIRRTIPTINYLHSLDSLRLASALSSECVLQAVELDALIEVNVTNDTSKTGLPKDALASFLSDASKLPGLNIRGLMAMTSRGASPTDTRKEFGFVRQLRDKLQSDAPDHVCLHELSMGMSGDFREAIAEGATLVRIGSNLWQGIL